MAKENRNRIKKTRSDVIFSAVVVTLLALVLIITAYPLYFVVVASISDPSAVNSGQTLLFPKGMTLISYQKLFEEERIWRGYANSAFYTVFGTLFSLILTIPAGYALSRKDMPLKKIIMKYFIVTMFFGGGLIPTYMVVDSLGLINTRWVLIVLGAVSISNIILARTYFNSTIPQELYEAAEMDGCTNSVFLVKIVVPLSKAIVAVLALYVGVGQWNQYFSALIYITDEKLYPLQMIVRDILLSTRMASTDQFLSPQELEEMQKTVELLKYSVLIVSSLPVFLIYPFLQKYFVKGVMIGSLKA